MNAVKLIEGNGRIIFVMDLSNPNGIEDISARVEEIILQVRKTKERNSIYALLDLTNLKFNSRTLPFLKKLSMNNGPYMKYVAFVGLNGVYSIVFRTMFRITKRVNHNVIKTKEKAITWLSEKE